MTTTMLSVILMNPLSLCVLSECSQKARTGARGGGERCTSQKSGQNRQPGAGRGLVECRVSESHPTQTDRHTHLHANTGVHSRHSHRYTQTYMLQVYSTHTYTLKQTLSILKHRERVTFLRQDWPLLPYLHIHLGLQRKYVGFFSVFLCVLTFVFEIGFLSRGVFFLNKMFYWFYKESILSGYNSYIHF